MHLHSVRHARDLLIGPTEEEIKKSIERSTAGQFIVLAGDERVGMLMLAELEPWLYEIRRMISLHEGRGIGTYALTWAMGHIFEERHAHRAYLEVHARNVRARSLYERCGFLCEGTYRDGARNPQTGAYEDLCIYGLLEGEYRRRLTTCDAS